MSFGETLYTLRKEKNMSQENLARELSTSRQAVSKWENNQGFPEMDKLKIMSNLFGVSIDYMINGEQVINERKNEQGYYADTETNEKYEEKVKIDRTPFTFWQIICFILLSLAALAAIYIITGGEGHIANGLEKIISKL